MKMLLRGMLLALLICVPLVLAQDSACEEWVDQAVSAALEQCGAREPGTVCLAHAPVETVFRVENPPTLAQPGDTVPLETVCSMQLGGLQTAQDWGIALMHVQPTGSALPVSYALFGNVHIQNLCSGGVSRPVEIIADTEIHSGPGSQYEVIGSLNAGAVVVVNACNCTGNWLRTVLEDGRIGWILTIRTAEQTDASATPLPVAAVDTPIYAAFQAFTLVSGEDAPMCPDTPNGGLLIQAAPDASEPARLQINAVDLALQATVFIQSQPNGEMHLLVLAGHVQVKASGLTLQVPAGVRVVIPMNDASAPDGEMQMALYSAADVAGLPLALLPQTVDPLAPLQSDLPQIVGAEQCSVVSGTGDSSCPVYFINPDGDAITRMDVVFEYAPQGEWEGSVTRDPGLLSGDARSGALDWQVSCTLGTANFIGPVIWSITITDEAGHSSAPFEASFNCVDG